MSNTFESWYRGFQDSEDGEVNIHLDIRGHRDEKNSTVTVRVGDHESTHEIPAESSFLSPEFMADQALSTLVDSLNRLIFTADPTAEEFARTQQAQEEEV